MSGQPLVDPAELRREAELSMRVEATGLQRDELLEIESKCGLLFGPLAHLVCRRGHKLVAHS